MIKKLASITLSLVFCVNLFVPQVQAAEITLPTTRVYNSDFEAGTVPAISGWTKDPTSAVAGGTMETADGIGRNATRGVRMVFNNFAHTANYGFSSPLSYSIKANTDYYGEIWVKSDSLVTNGKKPNVVFQATAGSGVTQACDEVALNQDWTKYSKVFNSSNTTNSQWRVIVRRYPDSANPISGTVYVDDCYVVEKPASVAITNTLSTKFSTETVALNTDLSVKATYANGDTAVINDFTHLNWSVTSANAAINNGVLNYTGQGAGTVTLEAEYAATKATTTIEFKPRSGEVILLPTTRIYNGDFESGAVPTISGWQKDNITGGVTAETVEAVGRNGSRGVKIQYDNFMNAANSGLYSLLTYDIKQNTDYYGEIWVKSEDITTTGRKPNVVVGKTDGSSAQNLPDVAANQDWTKYSAVFNSATTPYTNWRIMVRRFPGGATTNPISGTIYVDDAFIVEKPSMLEITNELGDADTLQTVDLNTALPVNAIYANGNSAVINDFSHLYWKVTSNNASIVNGVLSYTGPRRGGAVTVEAEYAAAKISTTIHFTPSILYYVDTLTFKKDGAPIGALTDGAITCETVIENFDAVNAFNSTLILALYKDNKFVSVAKSVLTPVPTGGNSTPIGATINVPTGSGYSIKAFVWDSIEGLRPLQTHKTFDTAGLH